MKTDEAQMKWGLADKARQRDLQATKNRSKDIRDRLEKEYGIDPSLPDREHISKREMNSLNRKYKYERPEGTKDSVRNYGAWDKSPRRIKG